MRNGIVSAVAWSLVVLPAWGSSYDPPARVEVLPVFFVPQGQPEPTPGQVETLMAHLEWSQERYYDMLDCRETFAISPMAPRIYASNQPLSTYMNAPENGAPLMTSELLSHFGYDRFNTPHIYLMIMMNPAFDFPPGGGRPINGGFDQGGGIVVMSSHALDNAPNFQSTLQHELGHAFGLPHVDVYGYSMDTNDSIMSYNLAHHTNFFEPSPTPGVLIPEDIRGLHYNRRAFPRLTMTGDDIPPEYVLAPAVWLGPMTLPGQVNNVVPASTSSGETFGSSVQNVIQGRIRRSQAPVGFDPGTMWHSALSETGWVSVTLDFPIPVTLDRLVVHSEHSGAFHRAEHAIVLAMIGNDSIIVANEPLPAADVSVPFPETTAQRWVVQLQAGASGYVVIRGLQFYRDDVEHFPPYLPLPVPGSCPLDLDGDGSIGSGDLIELLAGWGPAPAGPADFDCDGVTGTSDLIMLLAAWSSCE